METDLKFFRKRPGTVNVGVDYECLSTAYFILKMIKSKLVKDFEITFDEAKNGWFDDLAIKLLMSDGSFHTCLFQIKHQMNKSKIIRNINFKIEELQHFRLRENLSLIFFTNITCKSVVRIGIGYAHSRDFELEKSTDGQNLPANLFNTGKVFRIKNTETELEEENTNFFFIYSDQKDVRQIEILIDEMLKDMFGCQLSDHFINFIRKWKSFPGRNYILTKKIAILKIAEAAFSPFFLSISDEKYTEKCQVILKLMQSFQIVLIERSYDTIAKIWKRPIDLSPISKLTTLEDFIKIIRVDEWNRTRIESAINLLQENSLLTSTILVGKLSKNDFLPYFKVFQDLSDAPNLDLEPLLLSLQDKPPISLKQLLESNPKMASIFTTDHLLQMTQEVLKIEQKVANLPHPHLKRRVNCSGRIVEEKEIFKVFINPINLISAPPGSGKSTLMASLANNSPWDFWAVYVSLNTEQSFLQSRPKFDDFLPRFMKIEKDKNGFLDKIKRAFLESCKIYLFLDGLDEVLMRDVDFVLEYVKYISSRGIRVWLSSRQHLEKYLNLAPVHIEELTEDQVVGYFKSRNVEIGPLLQFLPKNPLQLALSAEILQGGVKVDGMRLTTLYKELVKFKLKDSESADLEMYEYLALKACLNPDSFEKLKLRYDRRFLQKIKREGDKLKIIASTENDNVTFNNQLFAEYFASLCLFKNRDQMGTVADELFVANNTNLKYMLDLMLGENSPIHLAVVSQNVNDFKTIMNQSFEDLLEDLGGRTPLHLASSYQNIAPEIIIDLLPHFDIFKKDRLLAWNCIDYALKANAFFAIEKFLEKHGDSQHFDPVFEKKDIASVAAQNGFLQIISCLIKRKREVLQSPLLHQCVNVELSKSTDIVDLLTKEDFDIDCRNGKYKTALELALEKGNLGFAELLIKKGADINVVDIQKKNLLHRSVNSLKLIDFLIDNGIDKNAGDFNGRTVLHLACKHGNVDSVQRLIEKKVDVGRTTFQKKTALFYAIDNVEIVNLLIENHVDVDFQDIDGITVLHLVAQKGDFALFEKLFQKNRDINIKTKNGRSILHYAASAKVANVQMIKFLVDRIDINCQDTEGLTPLHLAAKNGIYDNVKKIFEIKENLLSPSKQQQTALHFAISTSSEEVIKFLIENGMEINCRDLDGMTPLHLASKQGDPDLVELLLDLGSDVNAVTAKGESALHLTRDLEVAKLLIENGIDINLVDENGVTALHLACQRRQLDLVMNLIERIEAFSDKKGRNFLHYAAQSCSRNVELINFLLDSGKVSIEADQDGVTPLHLAASCNNDYNVEVLIRGGAEVNAETKLRRNALHFAAEAHLANLRLINLLIDNGVDVQLEDSDGVTPLQIAEKRCNLPLKKLLLQRESDTKKKVPSM